MSEYRWTGLRPRPIWVVRSERLVSESAGRHALSVVAWTLSDSWRPEIGRSRLSEGDQAAIIFSVARGMASRKVGIGVFPKHQRPWCGLFSLYNFSPQDP